MRNRLLLSVLFFVVRFGTGFVSRSPSARSSCVETKLSSGNTDNVNSGLDRREAIRSSLLFVAAGGVATAVNQPCFAAYIDPNTDLPRVTRRVYLDVAISDPKDKKAPSSGRLVIGLFGELMPRAAENFERLCSGNVTATGGYSYEGTTFYRVLSGFTIQGGAIGDPTGKTGRSAFEGGVPFEPDNYNVKHSIKGLVSTVRGAAGGADSRFFINTADEAGWADDRYAAFGLLEEGMDLVAQIEKVDVQPPANKPKKDVTITGCGVLETIKRELTVE